MYITSKFSPVHVVMCIDCIHVSYEDVYVVSFDIIFVYDHCSLRR